MTVERGTATKVSTNDPTKSPGRLFRPRDMAPSSRNGRTTKYALNICRKKKWTITDQNKVSSAQMMSLEKIIKFRRENLQKIKNRKEISATVSIKVE